MIVETACRPVGEINHDNPGRFQAGADVGEVNKTVFVIVRSRTGVCADRPAVGLG